MDDDTPVDLSLTPEMMLAVRDDVRLRLVQKVHFLRLSARLYRKVGDLATAKRHDGMAEKLTAMIRSIEPMEDPATWAHPADAGESPANTDHVDRLSPTAHGSMPPRN